MTENTVIINEDEEDMRTHQNCLTSKNTVLAQSVTLSTDPLRFVRPRHLQKTDQTAKNGLTNGKYEMIGSDREQISSLKSVITSIDPKQNRYKQMGKQKICSTIANGTVRINKCVKCGGLCSQEFCVEDVEKWKLRRRQKKGLPASEDCIPSFTSTAKRYEQQLDVYNTKENNEPLLSTVQPDDNCTTSKTSFANEEDSSHPPQVINDITQTETDITLDESGKPAIQRKDKSRPPEFEKKVIHVKRCTEMNDFGFDIEKCYDYSSVQVYNVKAGCPASQEGLKELDRLIEVNGQDLRSMSLNAVKRLVKDRFKLGSITLIALTLKGQKDLFEQVSSAGFSKTEVDENNFDKEYLSETQNETDQQVCADQQKNVAEEQVVSKANNDDGHVTCKENIIQPENNLISNAEDTLRPSPMLIQRDDEPLKSDLQVDPLCSILEKFRVVNGSPQTGTDSVTEALTNVQTFKLPNYRAGSVENTGEEKVNPAGDSQERLNFSITGNDVDKAALIVEARSKSKVSSLRTAFEDTSAQPLQRHKKFAAKAPQINLIDKPMGNLNKQENSSRLDRTSVNTTDVQLSNSNVINKQHECNVYNCNDSTIYPICNILKNEISLNLKDTSQETKTQWQVHSEQIQRDDRTNSHNGTMWFDEKSNRNVVIEREQDIDRILTGGEANTITNKDVIQQQKFIENEDDNLSTGAEVSSDELCVACNERLGRGTAVRIESLRVYYHMSCFRCAECGRLLEMTNEGVDVEVRPNYKLCCNKCSMVFKGFKGRNLGI